MGTHPRTTEAIIGRGADIYKVRTIRRNYVGLRWCEKIADELTKTAIT